MQHLAVLLPVLATSGGHGLEYEEDCTGKCVQSCPAEWEEFGSHCYFRSGGERPWKEAEEECRKGGGHLAAVTSKEIHDFIWNPKKKNWE